MRNKHSSNNVNYNLDIDDLTKQQYHPLLSTLNVPFTSHTISTLVYEIVKLSKVFSDSCRTKIKHPQGSTSEVISILTKV